MGVGAGCGVGWGPGFGPEAVGFVGGGCGVGFSVGLTFIGFGIGLPASGLTCLPYNALTFVTREAFNFARLAAPVVVDAGNQGLRSISHQASEIQRNMLKGVRGIQSPHSSAFSTSIEASAKKSWHSVEMTILEWEKKLRSQASRSWKLVGSKCPPKDSR